MKAEKYSLIGYAMSFASFLLDSEIGGKINRIILFGSVARGDYSQSSDVDVFIDSDLDIEKAIEKLLILFGASRINETWKLKGVRNDISVKVGSLSTWTLRREVISSGIILYGKYNETPDKAKYYLMIRMDLRNIRVAKQMAIWRKLYGYRQKIGNKVYTGKGLVDNLGGRKLGKAVILVPMENRKDIIDFLNKSKMNYTVNELWSDTF